MIATLVVLIIIFLYLLISNYVYVDDDDNNIKYKQIDKYEVLPGMVGSPPSNKVSSYDNTGIINLSENTDKLLESYKNNANIVYTDFVNKKNSTSYKSFIYDNYRIQLLNQNGLLTEDQLKTYLLITNTTSKQIHDLFKYHLNYIKHNIDNSYELLQSELFDSVNNKLKITEREINQIINYVLSYTIIPTRLILLLKTKLPTDDKIFIETILRHTDYDFSKALDIIEYVLIKEPQNGEIILDIPNNPIIQSNNTIYPGFWSIIYLIFKNNNINYNLFLNIKMSYLNEQISKLIIGTIISRINTDVFIIAIDNILNRCNESSFDVIKYFPFSYTLTFIVNAINDIKLSLLDSSYNRYKILEVNSPITVQNIKLSTIDSITTYDFNIPSYNTISKDFITESKVLFPPIKHRGVYLDRSNGIKLINKGSIIIKNINNSTISLENIIIYCYYQYNVIRNDFISIENSLLNNNVLSNKNDINIEIGNYSNKQFIKDTDDLSINNWISNNIIIIPPNKSLRISIINNDIIGPRYLQIMSLFLPFTSYIIPSSLEITVLQDKLQDTDIFIENKYVLSNISRNMKNLMFVLDSEYNIINNPTLVKDTLSIINNNIRQKYGKIVITGSNNGILTIDSNKTIENGLKNDIIINSDPPEFIPNERNSIFGLTTDTILASQNPNKFKSSYRIKLTNTSDILGETIIIRKIIIFGNTSPINNFIESTNLYDILSDDNILLGDSIINLFTMNNNDTIITGKIDKSIIVDTKNKIVQSSKYYSIDPGKSLFIEPILSSETPLSRRYVNIKAIYIDYYGLNKSSIKLSITNIKYDGTTTTSSLSNTLSDIWKNNEAVLIMFNPITPSIVSQFSVQPKSNKTYEEYYNPASELTQMPQRFY